MSIVNFIKNICKKLGENNKPIYAVMAIAVAKGIARPTLTMLDKTEDPETKRYTALREGLTEVVAIPTYYCCGEAAAAIGGKLNLSPENQALAKHNFMFLGVCAAALFVIPALASLTIKPFMKKIQSKKNEEKPEIHTLDINTLETETNQKPVNFEGRKTHLSTFSYPTKQFGNMKVGSL